MDDHRLNDQVAHLDVVTFLSAMLTNSLSQYQDDCSGNYVLSQQSGNAGISQPEMEKREEERNGEVSSEERDCAVIKQQLLNVLSQGIHLLKAMRYSGYLL